MAAQHFPCEVDNWEGLPAASCMWQAWKVAFRLAHLKHQRQLQALGGGKALGGAHTVIPTATPTIDCIGKALENLALAASNDTTILQQLITANLALTALVTSLTVANKKLADALARNKGGTALATQATPVLAPAPPKPCSATRAFLGTTAGPMVTGSIASTQVQPASTERRDTRRMQRPPTRWVVVKRTRDGTPTPEGVGEPM